MIYKSGKIEVNGRVRLRGNVTTTINFPFNFPDTDYSVSMLEFADVRTEGQALRVRTKTINSMSVEETKDNVTYWVDFIILWLPENLNLIS